MDIKGIIPAVVTPLDRNEDLNLISLRRLVDFLIDNGVHGLFVTGSQGEFYALTPEEKCRVWEIAVDAAAGRVPVYAGTGAITTREVLDLNKAAAQAGVDAVSVITPFYIQPSEHELYYHYSTIADASPVPVLLYNNPGRTGGVNLSPDLVARLAEHPNIVGIKDSSGDLTLTAEYVRRTNPDFAVLMGRDTLIYAGLVYGARGAIAASANVAPRFAVEIYEAFMAGDHERALQAQRKLAPLRLAFSLGTFPVVIKEALNLMGLEVGPARSPVRPLDEQQRQRLKAVLTDLGLLGEPK